MSDKMLIEHCSPTLAGMKTGNMFSCRCQSKNELNNYVRRLNRLLGKKGIRVLPLKLSDGRALIYIYRPSKLEKDFFDEDVISILKEYGYEPENPNRCVVCLINKLRLSEEFPHEIGLFLGYPPEDVKGFINSKSEHCECKYVGCWKVFGDEEKAIKIFNKYKKCTDVYCSQWQMGRSVEKLTVAV